MQYHHTGVVTDQKQPNEMYVEATKVWITNPDEHPCRIEYVRYEPDTPVDDIDPQVDSCLAFPHAAFSGSRLAGAWV